MKNTFYLLAGLLLAGILFTSCEQDNSASTEQLVSPEVIGKVKALGFNPEDIQKIEEGYLVEGDIVLTDADLAGFPNELVLRVANCEQYRTTNLVNAPRTITVSMESFLRNKAGYNAALQEVVNRYNAENLGLTFVYTTNTSGGNIHFKKGNGNYLASAGFPSGGNPYNTVKINANFIGQGNSPTFINYLATIMAHEAGHCIGFRHTDYMDRSYSCGGSYYNEGQAGVGAILIPGTPTGPDPNSWMLSCIGSGQNRPFNNNDRTALSYLY